VEGENEVKVGVFICDCGHRIADVIDLAALEKDVKAIPRVAVVRRELYSCSQKGLHNLKEAVGEHGLNRIVVAGCTPRTHERLFRGALEDAGLKGSLFEMVNIREQCALVHAGDKEGATKKALDLIRMGVAKASLLGAREKMEVQVTPAALVVGGGIAGLTAALTVAKAGFPVKLAEKEEQLGGTVGKLHTLYPRGESAADFIGKRIAEVRDHRGIKVLTSARVADVSGSIGNYRVTVEGDSEASVFDVGAIIVATGSQEARPADTTRYDGQKVITQLELERKLGENNVDARHVVLMLDAVDSPVYSSIPAASALKNALLLKRKDPKMEVSLLFNKLGADLDERQLQEARDSGVRFYKFDGQGHPQVTADTVELYDELRGEEVSIPHDLLVLAMPLVPEDDAPGIARLFRLPADSSGFLSEPNIRLRPRDYVPAGVFLCGSAHYPADVRESIFQAFRAAAKTVRYLSEGKVGGESAPAIVIEDFCTGCGSCVEACPFQAITLESTEGTLDVSRIDPLLCKSCGNCVVVCPTKAIVMQPYTDREVIAQIDAALAAPRDGQPRILGLMCEWSGYAAADLAGAEALQYPSNIRIVRMGCSARFDPYHILWAFLNGADGIILGACEPGVCHYIEGNRHAEERVEDLRKKLKYAGFDPRRLKLQWFKPDDAQKFVEAVKDFTEDIEYLEITDL
jgi:heterodisulfide reductase subunit A